MTASPLSTWNADNVRLTLFPVVQLQGLDVVTRVFRIVTGGSEPDETTSKASAATHIVHGTLAGGRLIVAAQPGRIDVQLALDALGGPTLPLSLGPSETVLGDFLRRVRPIFDDCPPVHRLAFGALLLQKADSIAGALKTLEPFLPSLRLDAETSTDLLYQINRPRPTRTDVAGLRINRLAKWSAQSISTVQFGAAIPSISGVSSPMVTYSACLEADISTVADQRELPAASLAALVEEQVDITREIATTGDIP